MAIQRWRLFDAQDTHRAVDLQPKRCELFFVGLAVFR